MVTNRLSLFAVVLSSIASLFAAEAPGAQVVTNAYDTADNYGVTWTNGANGGAGFGAWKLWSSDGVGGYGGWFLGNPARAGMTGMSSNAFGLYAHPTGSGSYANAERNLSAPLAVGQTLRFQWSFNYDSGWNGEKGFLLMADASVIIGVSNTIPQFIFLNGTNVGFDYGVNAMTWSFTRTASNSITVVANDRDGSGTYSNEITVPNGAITAFRFYASNMQPYMEAEPYFNNFEVFGPAQQDAGSGAVAIVSTIDSGGSVQSGGNVQITGFLGQPGVVASGGNVVARQGGNSMVYYATGFSVASDALTINEQGAPDTNSSRTQLRGSAVYDDATFGVVDGSQISWAAPSTNSALASVSTNGLAQAGTVYQNTAASFTGSYSGFAATNLLTVLNVMPDNYGAWAGDTFNDAWEIAQGMTGAVNPAATNNGVPNWQLYAMGFNPAQPAPAVLASAAMTNGYLAVRYTRNPYATNYAFTPQESGDLSVGLANMVNPVSATNTSGGIDYITTRGSVPMNVTNKQFLRVKVAQPAP